MRRAGKGEGVAGARRRIASRHRTSGGLTPRHSLSRVQAHYPLRSAKANIDKKTWDQHIPRSPFVGRCARRPGARPQNEREEEPVSFTVSCLPERQFRRAESLPIFSFLSCFARGGIGYYL